MSNFMKIRPMGTELFHVGRETYRQTGGVTDRSGITRLIVASRNFANSPKIFQTLTEHGTVSKGVERNKRISRVTVPTLNAVKTFSCLSVFAPGLRVRCS
jgi:hypothetical protein